MKAAKEFIYIMGNEASSRSSTSSYSAGFCGGAASAIEETTVEVVGGTATESAVSPPTVKTLASGYTARLAGGSKAGLVGEEAGSMKCSLSSGAKTTDDSYEALGKSLGESRGIPRQRSKSDLTGLESQDLGLLRSQSERGPEMRNYGEAMEQTIPNPEQLAAMWRTEANRGGPLIFWGSRSPLQRRMSAPTINISPPPTDRDTFDSSGPDLDDLDPMQHPPTPPGEMAGEIQMDAKDVFKQYDQLMRFDEAGLL